MGAILGEAVVSTEKLVEWSMYGLGTRRSLQQVDTYLTPVFVTLVLILLCVLIQFGQFTGVDPAHHTIFADRL